jgi:hypothetical protein
MKILTRKNLALARNYIETHARPLDWALYEYHFESAPVESVMTQLEEYQNPDGGFGNSLEPDVRTPTSSTLATEIGLRKLMEMKIPPKHPKVQEAVVYLLDTFEPKTKTWRVVPRDVNEYPHAPWWHDEAGSLAQTFDDFLVIPRAGILACLLHYNDLVPKAFLDDVVEATLHDIQDAEDEIFGGGGDGLVYTRRLATAPHLQDSARERLCTKVKELTDKVVTRDPEKWSQYSAPPLKLAPTPDSITAEVLADCIPAYLDYLIGRQSPEGYWDPTWSWSEYSDDWEVAKREWRGDLTLDALVSLKAYGRIEL